MSAVRSHLWFACENCGVARDQETMHLVDAHDGVISVLCRTGAWRDVTDDGLEAIRQHALDLLGTASREQAARRKRAEMFAAPEARP